eukprot:5851727-Prorocentrum_lima.AAC.1
MTSSLVGSEMCIRDRCWAMDVAIMPLITSHATLNARPCGVEAICATQGTVSYTHLTLPTICSV